MDGVSDKLILAIQVQMTDAIKDIKRLQDSFTTLEKKVSSVGTKKIKVDTGKATQETKGLTTEVDRLNKALATTGKVAKMSVTNFAGIKYPTSSIKEHTRELERLAKAEENARKAREKSNATQGNKSMSAQINESVLGMGKFVSTAYLAQQALQVVGQELKRGLDFNIMKEQAQLMFGVMLKDGGKAKDLMADLVDLSLKAPIGLDESAASAKQLLAYGFEFGSIVDNMKMLGTVSAATGGRLDDLAYVYGTLRTQNRAYTRDLMQFAMRGIPIYDELAKVLGVSTKEIKALTEAGKVEFNQVAQAFQNMTNSGGIYAGALEVKMESLGGKMEVLGKKWEMLMGRMAEGPIAGAVVDALSYIVDSYLNTFTTIKDSMDKGAQKGNFVQAQRQIAYNTREKPVPGDYNAKYAKLEALPMRQIEETAKILEMNMMDMSKVFADFAGKELETSYDNVLEYSTKTGIGMEKLIPILVKFGMTTGDTTDSLMAAKKSLDLRAAEIAGTKIGAIGVGTSKVLGEMGIPASYLEKVAKKLVVSEGQKGNKITESTALGVAQKTLEQKGVAIDVKAAIGSITALLKDTAPLMVLLQQAPTEGASDFYSEMIDDVNKANNELIQNALNALLAGVAEGGLHNESFASLRVELEKLLKGTTNKAGGSGGSTATANYDETYRKLLVESTETQVDNVQFLFEQEKEALYDKLQAYRKVEKSASAIEQAEADYEKTINLLTNLNQNEINYQKTLDHIKQTTSVNLKRAELGTIGEDTEQQQIKQATIQLVADMALLSAEYDKRIADAEAAGKSEMDIANANFSHALIKQGIIAETESAVTLLKEEKAINIRLLEAKSEYAKELLANTAIEKANAKRLKNIERSYGQDIFLKQRDTLEGGMSAQIALKQAEFDKQRAIDNSELTKELALETDQTTRNQIEDYYRKKGIYADELFKFEKKTIETDRAFNGDSSFFTNNANKMADYAANGDVLGLGVSTAVQATQGTQLGKVISEGNPLLQLATAFISAASEVESFNKVMNWASTIMEGAFEYLGPVLEKAFQPVANLLKQFGRLIGQMLTPIIRALGEGLQGFADAIIWVMNLFISAYNGFANWMNSTFGTQMDIADRLLYSWEAMAKELEDAKVKDSLTATISYLEEKLDEFADSAITSAKDLYEVGAITATEYEAQITEANKYRSADDMKGVFEAVQTGVEDAATAYTLLQQAILFQQGIDAGLTTTMAEVNTALGSTKDTMNLLPEDIKSAVSAVTLKATATATLPATFAADLITAGVLSQSGFDTAMTLYTNTIALALAGGTLEEVLVNEVNLTDPFVNAEDPIVPPVVVPPTPAPGTPPKIHTGLPAGLVPITHGTDTAVRGNYSLARSLESGDTSLSSAGASSKTSSSDTYVTVNVSGSVQTEKDLATSIAVAIRKSRMTGALTV